MTYNEVANLRINLLADYAQAEKLVVHIKKLKTTIDVANNSISKMSNILERAKRALISQGMGAATANRAMKGFIKDMPNLGLKFNKFNEIVDMQSGKLVKLGQVTNKMSKYTLKRFAGEWLSLMFIGQGVSMAFQRMLNPVIKLAGVYDVWRVTLISLMGPVMFPFSRLVRRLMGNLRRLDSVSKAQIGAFTLLGTAFTKLISPIAQVSILVHTLGGWKTVIPIVKKFSTQILNASTSVAGFNVNYAKTIGLLYLGAEAGFAVNDVIKNWDTDMAKVGKGVLTIISLVVLGILGLFHFLTWGWVVAIGVGIVWLLKLFATFESGQKIFESFGKSFKTGLFTKEGWAGGGYQGITPMASGGVVTRPTLAMIGEAGPEAVVPLSGGGGMGGVGMNYNPTINVYGGGSSAMDIDRIVREVNSRLYDDTMRM